MVRAAIRRLGPGDEDLLRSTRLQALADSPAAFATVLAEAESRPRVFWENQVNGRLGEHSCATWVAVDDAGIGVGMITGVEQAGGVEVIQVWVHPGWRGSGLIDELFAALFIWAPRDRIDVAVAKSNSRARRVYVRLGFQFVRERPGFREAEVEMSQVRAHRDS